MTSDEVNEVTEEQVTALIDELFEKLPKASDGTPFHRVKTPSGDAVQFAVGNDTGRSYHTYELNHFVKFLLQRFPPRKFPDRPMFYLISFVDRLPLTMRLGIDNATDLSTLEATEDLFYLYSAITISGNSDLLEAARDRCLKSVQDRNREMSRRHKWPRSKTDMLHLISALMKLRQKKPGRTIEISMIARRLKCTPAAVYKALKDEEVSVDDFLNS